MIEGLRDNAPAARRHEIEVSVDNDPRAVFWRQGATACGRAALMSYIFDVDRKIER